MLPNPLFSMIGMLMSALYITLVKIVVSYFECPANPAAPATLSKHPDVVCDSDLHKEALPAMVLGLLVYVVGFYSLTAHAALTAPQKWNQARSWRGVFRRELVCSGVKCRVQMPGAK